MPEIFNPNELILEKIRAVEEYDPDTEELVSRYTQVKEPALNLSSEETPVTDAMGSRIGTFYNAQSGTFSFTNALFSVDLAASQFGAKKVVASAENKILVPVSEIIPIGSDHIVHLKYVPVGAKGAEIKYVKVLNGNNFGDTYEIAAAPEEGKFTLDAENKQITMPENVTGKIFVNYIKESENAVSIAKTTDGVPEVRKLIIHVIFHEPCNTNIVYAGAIVCHRAQIDPTSIDINLTSDGGHPASYILQKEYCAEDGKLIEVIVDKN